MTNHIHLALQCGDLPLQRGMQNLSFRYTRWINWQTKRTGHLFQGRYKAVLVDSDSYLLELVRYIHLNPVRAGMVWVFRLKPTTVPAGCRPAIRFDGDRHSGRKPTAVPV
jgi:hypothetical protein